jgi:hypothetical protein
MAKFNSQDSNIDFNDRGLSSGEKDPNGRSGNDYNIEDDDLFERVNIKKYKDPEGMTLEKMKFGFWVIRNKGYFYTLVVALLLIFSLSGWFIFLFVFGHYTIFGSRGDNLMIINLLNNTLPEHSFFLNKAAKDLIFGESGYLKNNNDSYDFYAKITNTNKNHWTKFNYSFAAGNDISESRSDYILPGESKYILLLNQKGFKNINSKPQLKIEDLNWMRVNAHKYKEWRNYKNEYLNFEIKDKELVRAQNTNLSEKISLNELKFIAHNKSAYNYYNVDFIILLRSGDEIQGVNKYSAENLRSGSLRNFNFVWPGNFGRINDIYIEQQINVFDLDNFMRFDR